MQWTFQFLLLLVACLYGLLKLSDQNNVIVYETVTTASTRKKSHFVITFSHLSLFISIYFSTDDQFVYEFSTAEIKTQYSFCDHLLVVTAVLTSFVCLLRFCQDRFREHRKIRLQATQNVALPAIKYVRNEKNKFITASNMMKMQSRKPQHDI